MRVVGPGLACALISAGIVHHECSAFVNFEIRISTKMETYFSRFVFMNKIDTVRLEAVLDSKHDGHNLK